MALVVNSNPVATSATAILNRSNTSLQKSLTRLSSGFRIVAPADDAGGLAVSMKMVAALKRTEAVDSNLQNALSFLSTQDGALQVTGKLLDRISELRVLYSDPTKSSSDKSNYNTEFAQLKSQLTNLKSEKFNGVKVFKAATATSLTVTSNELGDQNIAITLANLSSNLAAVLTAATIGALTVGTVITAIQSIATSRAQNGAESSRLIFASEMLVTNKGNLESANSRIADTDIAQESTRYARYNILVQSGTAMLAQANAAPQAALALLR